MQENIKKELRKIREIPLINTLLEKRPAFIIRLLNVSLEINLDTIKVLKPEIIEALKSFERRHSNLLLEELMLILDEETRDKKLEKTWLEKNITPILALFVSSLTGFVFYYVLSGQVDTKDSIVPMIIGTMNGYIGAILTFYFTKNIDNQDTKEDKKEVKK